MENYSFLETLLEVFSSTVVLWFSLSPQAPSHAEGCVRKSIIFALILKKPVSLSLLLLLSLFLSLSLIICLYITHCVPLYVFVSLSLTEPRPLTPSEKAVSRHLGDPVGQEVMRGCTYLCSSAVFCPEWPRPPPPTVTT